MKVLFAIALAIGLLAASLLWTAHKADEAERQLPQARAAAIR